MGAIDGLHRRFGDRVAFFVVYIKEAHAEDQWASRANREEGIRVREPRSDTERAAVAERCRLHLGISIPLVVDSIDNVVARAYGAWPDRLYLVGKDGTIAYRGKSGPSGFRPDELELAIETELTRQ